jgi:apolipoprotein N-acyltransferase
MQGEAVRLQIEESTRGKSLISGAGIWEGNTSINLAYGFSQGKITDQFTKSYLVPFGEGLPFYGALKPVYDFFYRMFGFGQSYDKARGNIFDPITTPEVTAATYICYESVFPQVARTMVKRGAQVLVNISNDAWFGVSSGAEQHFLMGTMRAIETRRYLLRAGNDGITAVINPQGKVLERLERKIAGTLVGDYAVLDGMTLYVRFGDWLIWLVAGYAVVAGAILGFRRN